MTENILITDSYSLDVNYTNSADGTQRTPSRCLNIHLDERKRAMSNGVNGDTMFP